MNETPPPDRSSLERAQRLAREALEGPSSRSPQNRENALPSAGALPAKGSPARLSRTFAWFLDDLVPVPGTKLRFGVDPVLSFIPFAGTAVSAAMGSVILVDAVRLRAPITVLARMVGNYVIDWAIGLVPILGAFFDAAYRSNHKNYKLLERMILDRDQVRRTTLWYWIGILAMVLIVVVSVVGPPVALLLWLDSLITAR